MNSTIYDSNKEFNYLPHVWILSFEFIRCFSILTCRFSLRLWFNLQYFFVFYFCRCLGLIYCCSLHRLRRFLQRFLQLCIRWWGNSCYSRVTSFSFSCRDRRPNSATARILWSTVVRCQEATQYESLLSIWVMTDVMKALQLVVRWRREAASMSGLCVTSNKVAQGFILEH